MPRVFAVGRCFALAVALGACVAAAAFGPDEDPSVAFFRKGEIPHLVVEVDEAALAKLRNAPREWVKVGLKENKQTAYAEVTVKLKGQAGSFRGVDDRPALSLKVAGSPNFHGLRKFHLNNSVQDGSFLHELIGSELMLAAHVLTPRTTHARVWLNQRDLGFYVLKEGFDKLLLKRAFPKNNGNLYDGGFCLDIDADLAKEGGSGPDDRSDLKALLAACREPDLDKRHERLAELLDVPAFLTFMAMELMLGHWDGYTNNRNNYRLYFEPKSGKAYFLPHGMDQLFQDPNAPILDQPGPIVAAAVMKNPEWRQAYRARVRELLPLFDADKLKKRVDDVAARVAPTLKAMGEDPARGHAEAVKDLKNRIEARAKSLKEQAARPEPKLLIFKPNVAVPLPDGWQPTPESADAKIEIAKRGESDWLKVACGPSGRCVASWRRTVTLPQGHYRFEALVETKAVAELPGDDAAKGVGAGLRVSGGGRAHKLVGDGKPKRVEYEFDVAEPARDVVLVAELRAAKGEACFRMDSLKLTRVKK